MNKVNGVLLALNSLDIEFLPLNMCTDSNIRRDLYARNPSRRLKYLSRILVVPPNHQKQAGIVLDQKGMHPPCASATQLDNCTHGKSQERWNVCGTSMPRTCNVRKGARRPHVEASSTVCLSPKPQLDSCLLLLSSNQLTYYSSIIVSYILTYPVYHACQGIANLKIVCGYSEGTPSSG